MIANELTKLFNQRYISIELTIVIVYCMLYPANYVDLSRSKPNLVSSSDKIPINLILQFFLDNLLILVIGGIQIIFFKLISFRFPTNHQNFVDLCAITNISVFIIDEPLHGY